MAINQVIITFNEDVPVNGSIRVFIGDNGVFLHLARTVRTGRNEFTAANSISTGQNTARNYASAFQLDLPYPDGYSVTFNDNSVTITTFYDFIEFTGVQCLKLEGNPVLTDYDVQFNEIIIQPPFAFTSVNYNPVNSNRCGMVLMAVVTNQNMSAIILPVQVTGLTSNTFNISLARGTSGVLSVSGGDPNTIIGQNYRTPDLLNPANFNVQVNNSPNGATLIVNYQEPFGLQLQFSLDGINYQFENTFVGISPGDYTLYIKDQFGCIKTLAFTVDEIQSTRLPYFYISKSNSFRFANRISFSDAGNYRNDENTLSCEVNVRLPYKEIQQFQTADIITTQFKSNYNENLAYVILSNGTEIQIPVFLKSNNIGVTDSRDAIKVNLGNNKTGIYFQSGNIYDYNTGSIIEPYALNGTLPQWASFGNYFQIDGAWYLIDDIIYDDTLQADVIVIDAPYIGAPMNVIAGAVYDLFNYEVYEFTIDLVDYQNQNIRVRINNNDTTFGNLTHISELINVQVRQLGTVEIRYSNPDNTDIFYSTGITNLIRLPIDRVSAVSNQDIETYNTDTSVVLLNSDVYEMDKFTFLPVTKEIMRKLVQALSHKTLQMDGVYYVSNSPAEFDVAMGETNLYVVSANLVKTGGVFSSNSGSINDITDSTNIEVPGLIDIGDGSFIEYQ